MVVLGGETLLERAVRVAMEAALDPVIVVIAPDGEVAAGLCEAGCVVVVNKLAAEGMASSICRGVELAGQLGAQGVVLMTCDQVALKADHLRALCADAARMTGSGYAGKVGIPAYFPAASFAGLMELRGDAGAREMLRVAAAVVDEGLALDVDTEGDVEQARVLLG